MLCPFCKEEIQEGAVKCKHCGSMITTYAPPVIQVSSSPSAINKWNWAAFLWGPIWAIGHKVWIGLLAFIPFVGWIMNIVLGVKGSQWAWQKNNYASVEQFKAKQIKWVKAWFIFVVLIALFFAIMIPQYQQYQRRTAEDVARQQRAQAEKEATEWFNKGMAFSESHNYSDAIAAYDKAIELNPNDADFFTMRGVAYDDSGNVQEAIMDYNKALELNPKHGDAYLFRGDDFGKLGDEQQKINDFIMAARLGQKRAQEFLQSANIQW